MNPENTDDICLWLPNECVIDTNAFDSDELNQVVSIGSAPKPLYKPSEKPERKNKTEKKTSDHAESIANTETECRKEVDGPLSCTRLSPNGK
ncbi:unnamed protein product [Parnassius apollo]|uniref:(apollo) hypothetical protein n=1 Tax=Parnassius apollo TaxID=110799 RepID=A0A8S3XB73_PARAO|nr:unnamed protein product [Parnassius apollo]